MLIRKKKQCKCGVTFTPNHNSTKKCRLCRVRPDTKINKECMWCKRVVRVRRNTKYCSLKCGNAYRNSTNNQPLKKWWLLCNRCGIEFICSHGKSLYCSKECRHPPPPLPSGCYVYGWYQSPDHSLPFYIGKGTGRRAWEPHKNNGKPSLCQQLRTDEMVIKIYRENLTEEGSLLIESVLISVFELMGARLVNMSESLKRQEILPLEILSIRDSEGG